ncbi:MAG TPA: response regulator [Dongiaceae bacterium]|nr:response regulator [Dongiaceae bacterium]
MSDQPLAYVVDDDLAVRETLQDLLDTTGVGMRGFGTPKDFLEAERPDRPSCLILDVRLPGYSGLEFQRQLAAAGDEIPIIFITGHADVPMSVRAMKDGAVEFLSKPFRNQDLLDAIQHAIEKDRARRAVRRERAELAQRARSLTPRERQVMALLVAGKLNKQIGATLGATESTVKTHRAQVMRKMQAASVVELVRMSDKILPAL